MERRRPLSTKIPCPFCHKRIEEDSAFCRYCGQRIPQGDRDKQTIVNRTADFSDVDGALHAIVEYFDRWPDGPEARDVSLARHCFRLLINVVNVGQGKFEGAYEDITRLAEAAGQGLPTTLANGLATSARVQDEEKRDQVLTSLTALHGACAAPLQPRFQTAAEECQSLLVNGRNQAQIKRLTIDDVYRDARVHYASYEAGELDAALRGFTYLKTLNPQDAYFRNMLGSILLGLKKPLEALQEVLFGLSLDPGQVDLTANTLRCLCGLALFPAAVEVARHYERMGGNPEEPLIQPWSALARATTAALAMKLNGCTPQDLSPSAGDLIGAFEPPPRPWLTKPKSLAKVEHLLDDARVFISYRHAGGINYASRLERALKGSYPSMRLFRDESLLVEGLNFVDQLRVEIDEADLFLALIDQDWTGGKGKRSRLHNQQDFVRREVARAFARSVPVIPILLEGVEMPQTSDLPGEMDGFTQLNALSLSEARFDTDFGRLLSAMTQLLTEKKLEQRAIDKELEDLEGRAKQDSRAAAEQLDQRLKPALEQLQKYVRGESRHGEGVPLSSVELEGLWECVVTGPGWQATLRFTAEGTARAPFQGEFQARRGGPIGFWDLDPEEIRGTWMPVIDPGKNRLLGLRLDGLKSGAPFSIIIPFHRWLGNDLVGTDAQGATHSSRNVQPRRRGF